MREILFRAKRNDFNNREWVEGLVAQPHYWENGVVESYYFTEIKNGVSTHRTVSANTVGQYTGLTDKNGQKIFEGDILKNVMRWCDEERNGVVAFKDGAFGFIWYRGEVEMFHAFVSVVNIEYEIIGNTHDNPELLGGDNNE